MLTNSSDSCLNLSTQANGSINCPVNLNLKESWQLKAKKVTIILNLTNRFSEQNLKTWKTSFMLELHKMIYWE